MGLTGSANIRTPVGVGRSVHVGVVNPGFVVTEGFPQTELLESATTRWMVSTPEKAAEAIVDRLDRMTAELATH